MTDLLPACAYARHSDRKQEESVDQQIAEFRKYAALNGMRLIEPIFSDRAKSGRKSAGRDGLSELMAFLERRPRPCKIVLLWSSSRLARNVDDSAFYKASIRRAGYKIIYVGEIQLNIDNPVMRHVFEAVTESSDHSYSLKLGQDIRRGMLSHAGNHSVISRPPRGYRMGAEGKWEIDPEWADSVRRAWEMRAAGYSLADIHDALHVYATEYGYAKMFRNKTYLGILAWGGQEFPNFCEPLCTPEQWARVLAWNTQTREHPRRVRSVFLLSGRVVCMCGTRLKGNTQQQGQNIYRYYKCRRSPFHPRACGKTSWRVERLESAVIDQVLADFTPDKIGPLYAAQKAENRVSTYTTERQDLTARLARCQTAIENLLRAIEGGAAFASIAEQVSKREAERGELEKKLSKLAPAPAPRLDIDIPEFCAAMAAKLQGENVAEKRLALKALVERVEAGPETVKVILRPLPF